MNAKTKKSLLIGLGVLAGIGIIVLIVFLVLGNSKPGPPPPHSTPGPTPHSTPSPPSPQDSGLALGDGPSQIACWAWNTLVTGGFMGYGIFANKTRGYTWSAEDETKVATKGDTKWDEQGQNSTSTTKLKNTKALVDIDSGSQFVDFISKEGSYNQTYNRRALDGIKIQYDANTDQTLSDRYKSLLMALVNTYDLHVGILIGGKPLTKGGAYHGNPLSTMLTRIKNASQWIVDNKMGDNVYVALDIEPADIIMNQASLDDVYAWYKTIFPQVANVINGYKNKNVYYGMAINKNPYQNKDAYGGLLSLLTANWTTSDNKQRGFRILELMYWWTEIDTGEPLLTSHLASQLKTSQVGSNPVTDALNHHVYLQFGMECTGEVAYLMWIEQQSQSQPCSSSSCGKSDNPTPAACYRPLDGVIEVDTGIGYRCDGINSNPDMFSSAMPKDKHANYWNSITFKGDPKYYAPVYGFPFVPWSKSNAKYNRNECNALGNVTTSGNNLTGVPGPPTCLAATASDKSCGFLNKETWLLGGGLNHKSLEEFLHNDDSLDWLSKIVASVGNISPTKARSIIFKVPFCVEDLSGYSGWLHNFKYGRNSTTPKLGLADFPDNAIKTPRGTDTANGTICKSRITLMNGKTNFGPDGNVPCLGQTILDKNSKPLWISGTLEVDPSGKLTCPAGHYYSTPTTDDAGVY